eukprot:m.405862 g.405862  ORF g.405862 m.405862 type:complete len:469 (-) comp21211_c0_seq2:133-1539(-)
MKTLDGLHFAKVNLCCSTRPCHSQTRSALQWDSCSTYSQGCAVRIVVCSVGDSAPSWCANSYDPAMFELVRRTYATSTSDNSSNANKVSSGTGTGRPGVPSCNNAPVPGGKTDMNNCGGVSSDLIGGSWDYPDANYSYRKTIWESHRYYVQGLLWTMAHDPAIDPAVRAGMAKWGLCKDEFTASDNWPPALYVREARRMQGTHIFTQNTPEEQKRAGDMGVLSIGLGNYNFDSHNCQRFACTSPEACRIAGGPHDANGKPFAWDEGDVQIGPGVYQIPYWVLVPRASETDNLLVVGAPSATHIGMSTLRMEPQYMILGHAAGTAAAVSLQQGTTMANIDLATLSAKLRAQGQRTNTTITPPGPSCAHYVRKCVAERCIETNTCSSTPEQCPTTCKTLLANEWLANVDMFSATNTTVTAKGQATFLKKSEVWSKELPASELKAVNAHQSLPLSEPPVNVDDVYKIVTLA